MTPRFIFINLYQTKSIEMNKKQCLISFASKGREDYNKAMTRNIEVAKSQGYTDDFLYYSLDQPREVSGVTIKGGLPLNCPSHQDTPYGFKPFLFKEAFDRGYRQIIWLDSTIVLARNPQLVFDECKKRGVVAFHNLGHPLEKWISDKAVKNTGVNLSENPQQIMACVVGFDLENEQGKRIFDKWFALAQDGESFQNNPSTINGFVAHRHDQAILSALLHLEKIPLLPYGSLVYEAHAQGYDGHVPFFINKGVDK